MVTFIDILTGDLYEFKNWGEIIQRGGIKAVLPAVNYPNIWNLNALRESLKLNKIKIDIHVLKGS